AAFVIALKKQGSGSLESILLGNFVVALITLPVTISVQPDRQAILIALALGVVQLGIPYVLYAPAIQRVSAIDALFVSLIETVLNPLWVFLLLGEQPSVTTIAGGSIVLAAFGARALHHCADHDERVSYQSRG